MKLDIATAPRKDSARWHQETVAWNDFVASLATPATNKECGGYVFGEFRGERRDTDHLLSRSALVLDADAAAAGLVDRVRELGYTVAWHTTWRHKEKGPRYRFVLPFAEPVTADQYSATADALMEMLGGAAEFDVAASHGPVQFMFRPSTQDRAEYEFGSQDGDLLTPLVPAPRPSVSLHPYASAVIARELARLRACQEDGWSSEPGWDATTYEVACNLIELANSGWTGYSVEQALEELLESAPVDDKFGPREHAEKWASALQKVGGRGRPSPDDAAEAVEPEPAFRRRRLELTPAATIRPRRVRWLWEGRLALGTLCLLAGAEGLGKSTLAYWLAGQITRGELPGENLGQPRGVLVCATEDSWDHTVVPRLIAAGADLERVYRVEVLSSDDIHLGLSLPDDLRELEHAAHDTDAALLLLDPLMSRLGNLDTHKDAEVRRALEPLTAVADRTGMAVLGLIHHNKSGSSDPLNLVMASKAFTAVARSVHTVIRDPDDDTDTRRLFGSPKNNLGRADLPTLGFTIEGFAVATDDGETWTGQLKWSDEAVEGSIHDAMRRAATPDNDRTATSEAADWLEDYIIDNGGEAPSAAIKRDGAKAGHSRDALNSARKRLGIGSRSAGFPRCTFWFSQSADQSAQTARGDTPTALTASTGDVDGQSTQSAQSGAVTGTGTPTGGPDTVPLGQRRTAQARS